MSSTLSNLSASFAVADDLLGCAHEQLDEGDRFVVRKSGRIGPLVEMAMARHATPERYVHVAFDAKLMHLLDKALSSGEISGCRQNDFVGVFPLSRHDPRQDDQTMWDQWAKHAENAAARKGVPRRLAESLIGALIELQDNVYEHSGRADTGIAVYGVSPKTFEFAIADAGVGVHASLKRNPEFNDLPNAGAALRVAASDGASRHSRRSGHGYGIGQVFRALTNYNGDIRFRSDDYTLMLSGNAPSLTGRCEVAQKPHLSGLIISVRCALVDR